MERKELYTENYETRMKEMKDDIKRWRDIPCSWVGRIYIVKMTILLLLLSCFSRVQLCATLWTTAYQALLSMGFSRQEYLSGLPCPPPEGPPNPRIKPTSPATAALQVDSLLLSHQGSPYSSGNSAQCCVAAWMGGEFGGEWIHVHNTVNWLYFNIKLKVKIVTVVNY